MFDPSLLEILKTRIGVLEEKLSATATSGDQSTFQSTVRAHGRLKKILKHADDYFRVLKDFQEHESILGDEASEPELREIAEEELPELQETLPRLEKALRLALIPPDPNDLRNTILEIRAGTGGAEAALFAGDLYRMYSRYAESRGWKVEMIDASSSEMGGFKEVVFSVQGENVFMHLQFEGGAHRVQRVPVTEASGRIHTSAATVAVLAEAEDVDDIDIRPEDLRVDVYRASGAGGQHVNKTDSAVRITHIPSGTVVQSQEERSQHRNKEKCMRVLRSRILAMKQDQEAEKRGDSRRTQVGSGDRSERIRTYNFPQNRLTDHRINLTLYSLDKVMEGELDGVIEALQEHNMASSLDKKMSPEELLKLEGEE